MARHAQGVLLGAALAIYATSASVAADLPVKGPVYAPPPPMAIYNWTGFYIGVNAGYGWGEIDDAITPLPQPGFGFPPFSVGSEPDGFIGGIQLGYNWQTGNFVWGVEADFQGSTLDKTTVLRPGARLLPVQLSASQRSLTGSEPFAAGWASPSCRNCLPHLRFDLFVSSMNNE